MKYAVIKKWVAWEYGTAEESGITIALIWVAGFKTKSAFRISDPDIPYVFKLDSNSNKYGTVPVPLFETSSKAFFMAWYIAAEIPDPHQRI